MRKHKVETSSLCHSLDDKARIDRFKEAARDFETDDHPKLFDERLGKFVETAKVCPEASGRDAL